MHHFRKRMVVGKSLEKFVTTIFNIIGGFNMNNMSKAEYFRKYLSIWKKAGLIFERWRISEGLTKTFVADKIGISRSTLTKFERGKYVRDRKLIHKAYIMVQENHNLSLVISSLKSQQIQDIQIAFQYDGGQRIMTLHNAALRPAI